MDRLKRDKKELEDRIAHIKWRLQYCKNPSTKKRLENRLKEYEEELAKVNTDLERYE